MSSHCDFKINNCTWLNKCAYLLFCVADDNAALREFLRARNPKQQHSAALESYLIKPIQRILKYPLLLKQLHELTDPRSDENTLLKGQERSYEAKDPYAKQSP